MDAIRLAGSLALAALLPVLLTFASETAEPSEIEGPRPESVIVEHVAVTATRLPSAAASEVSRVPAHVTVITAEQIERSGVRTVQDLLAFEAGVVLYDQTGNDIEKTLDLRGFTGGDGVRVLLDGAPLNDTRNNTLLLDLVPLTALERVEILRGSAAALVGGGSEAGVIRLTTHRGGDPRGSLELAAGSDDATRFGGLLVGSSGVVDYLLSAARDETDGFRENAGGDLERLAGALGIDLGAGRRIELSVLAARTDLGNPGAVTETEDPATAEFNRLDFADRTLDQASVNFGGPLAGAWTLATNVFARDRGSEILSTGRSAASFGGFFLDSDERAHGATVQLTRVHRPTASEGELSLGLEWLQGETDAAGYPTPSSDPGQVDRSSPDSVNRARRHTLSGFVHESWSPRSAWTLSAGARLDRDRIDYTDRAPSPSNRGSREFSELSLRAGAVWRPLAKLSLHASYSEAFLPPTPEQLFSFPGFGSNPELDPQDSRSWEVGFRGRPSGGQRVQGAVFWIDTADEIVFDPDSPLGTFGANVNAGRTRRIGIETAWSGRVADRLDLFASATLVDAELQSGEARGSRVPLVPAERLAAGVDVEMPAGLALRVDGLWVGDQVLDNDDANAQERLASYAVANARLTWKLPRQHRGPNGDERGPVLFAEVRNLLDRNYASRGIYAFDFDAGQSQVFLTPAPGRRYLAGAEWRF